ncbi:Holliday junction branch migration protein RuvA [Candidatus Peregrinibacteria bacterium]|nr:MAG: Holliday junction branch migration protein RuvA [Candidatus Peregrinibacteria bacterium]
MIDEVQGVPTSISDRHVSLSLGAISFRLSCGLQTLSTLSIGKECVLKTYLHVREDELSLYGFLGESERELFLQLLSVSGIGPKAALEILSLGEESVRNAICSEDVALLTSVRGIGKRTAERVLVELREKVTAPQKMNTGIARKSDAFSEATDALEGLGFKKADILRVFSDAPDRLMDTETLIRWFLTKK